MRRKRTSKRRWKRRVLLGKPIPELAIVEHRLKRWFDFEPIGPYDFYRGKAKG